MRRLPWLRRAAQVAELRTALAQARADADQLATVLDMVAAERDAAQRDVEYLRARITGLHKLIDQLEDERSRLEAALAARPSAPSPTAEMARLRERCARLDADRAELIDLNDQLNRQLASRAGTLAKPHPQPEAAP